MARKSEARSSGCAAEPPHATSLPLATADALIGDPVRAAMLTHLSDGSRRPASELAFLAGASPQAASPHLARLVEGGLLAVEQHGRHRFYRIASGEIAEMIEGLSNWADRQPRRSRVDPALARARYCYDHLAGRLGVALFDRLAEKGCLALGSEGPSLSALGEAWCTERGIATAPPPKSRRPQIRLCLDWTERHYHLGGQLGASLASSFLERGYLRRRRGQRIVEVTPPGAAFLRRELGIELAR